MQKSGTFQEKRDVAGFFCILSLSRSICDILFLISEHRVSWSQNNTVYSFYKRGGVL